MTIVRKVVGAISAIAWRFRAYFAPTLRSWAFWLAFDLGDFQFMRKEMLGIKRRAETAVSGAPLAGLGIALGIRLHRKGIA